MIGVLSVESYLPIASFAIAFGGLLVRFFVPSGPAKETLLAAILIFLLLISAVVWRKNVELNELVAETGDEIVQFIGNDKKTYDEIVSGLRQPNHQLANAALELLIKQKRVGSEPVSIVDRTDKQFRIRLYFVRTF